MKRILVGLLCLTMLLCSLPITAFAAGDDPGDGNIDGGAASVSA